VTTTGQPPGTRVSVATTTEIETRRDLVGARVEIGGRVREHSHCARRNLVDGVAAPAMMKHPKARSGFSGRSST